MNVNFRFPFKGFPVPFTIETTKGEWRKYWHEKGILRGEYSFRGVAVVLFIDEWGEDWSRFGLGPNRRITASGQAYVKKAL